MTKSNGKRIVAQDAGIFGVIIGVVYALQEGGLFTSLESAHPALIAGIVSGVHLLTRIVAASGLTPGDTSPVIGSDNAPGK